MSSHTDICKEWRPNYVVYTVMDIVTPKLSTIHTDKSKANNNKHLTDNNKKPNHSKTFLHVHACVFVCACACINTRKQAHTCICTCTCVCFLKTSSSLKYNSYLKWSVSFWKKTKEKNLQVQQPFRASTLCHVQTQHSPLVLDCWMTKECAYVFDLKGGRWEESR